MGRNKKKKSENTWKSLATQVLTDLVVGIILLLLQKLFE